MHPKKVFRIFPDKKEGLAVHHPCFLKVRAVANGRKSVLSIALNPPIARSAPNSAPRPEDLPRAARFVKGNREVKEMFGRRIFRISKVRPMKQTMT